MDKRTSFCVNNVIRFEAIVGAGHKFVNKRDEVVGLITTRGNKIFNIVLSFFR